MYRREPQLNSTYLCVITIIVRLPLNNSMKIDIPILGHGRMRDVTECVFFQRVLSLNPVVVHPICMAQAEGRPPPSLTQDVAVAIRYSCDLTFAISAFCDFLC